MLTNERTDIMEIKIALAGNPNSGKTTLFNALTGSNQFVGNWPGVTVEKKEGRLKGHNDVIITDLPGIYSLSPYTLEEVVARNYLIKERPDAILNIIDGSNLERNLYLTTQLVELGIPVVAAVNMMDVVKKSGNEINTAKLSKELGCEVVEISALKGIGVSEAADKAIEAAKAKKASKVNYRFTEAVENALDHIKNICLNDISPEQKRWYAVKLFERDEKALEELKISDGMMSDLEKHIAGVEEALDDDSESIITNERYTYISSIISDCLKKKNNGGMTISDKIDRIVTNRWLGLGIFALVMWLVYYISMVTVGAAATDWTNDNLFGDGFHLLNIGANEYAEAAENYTSAANAIDAFLGLDTEGSPFNAEEDLAEMKAFSSDKEVVSYEVQDEETLEAGTIDVYFDAIPINADMDKTNPMTYKEAVSYFEARSFDEPAPSAYGVWVPGIPAVIESGLEAVNCADWLRRLILDGIVAGVGAVLGFVPQMLVLFFLLAFLEACGYMARIAFVMDRIFRKFGLSGKSFIPMLIGTGCGIPGIMASRTIENERDRRMTIMTTTFIPCGAKVPFIAMIAGALFNGSPFVSVGAYFIGIAAIIISGIMLKKTKMFAGDPAPFVMELPAYHLPTMGNLLRSMWERGWSFIKKAGTVILLSTVVVWFASHFGYADGAFLLLEEEQIELSFLALAGKTICGIFAPLGWGNWQATVAAITGLAAKENIVSTMGVLYGGTEAYANLANAFTAASGLSFLVFNLLCAPCFAAMGAIRKEMNSPKWFWFAIGYECGFAYCIALIVNQLGNLFAGNANPIGLLFALIILGVMIYMLFRPYEESKRLTRSVKVSE